MAEEEESTAVKLKIHYTFDTEHKNNHLCRPPQSFHVLTAEFNGPIGVIDLKSCLGPITGASPELTNFAEVDYTVYSYDVSEEDSPLTGHGLLSKLLSSEQDQSNENEIMITGKITQSNMAKFKKNAEPFLEIKLKLTPLSASFQRQRSGSVSSNHESISHWQATNSQPQSIIDRPQSPADMSRLDNVQRMVTEGVPRADSFSNGYGQWHPASRPSSRPGTPTQTQPYASMPPGSTHSVQYPMYINHPPTHERRGSESGYWTADEAFEDGPARKRAKTTKVQRATKDNFNIGHQPNSLRTAAMGASSLRMYQPTPMNPGAALQRGISTEEPVRPPTPVPQPRARKLNKRTQSRQNNMEIAEPSSPLQHAPTQNVPPFSNASTPEDVRERPRPRSATNTPIEMPSSPPVMMHHQTSPGLPSPPAVRQSQPKINNQDSGYFSTHTDIVHSTIEESKEPDIFADFQINQNYGEIDFSNFVNESFDLDMNLQSPMDTSQPTHDHYTPVFDDESSYEGPTPQADAPQTKPLPVAPTTQAQTIPVPMLMQTAAPGGTASTEPKQHDEFQRPKLPAQVVVKQFNGVNKNGRPNPTLLPRARMPASSNSQPPPFQRAQSTLPSVPASDPGTRSYKRSKTWTADMSDVPMSESLNTEEGKARARKRIGKEQTKARLESAIATGGMPPFCHNCGVIETPAWRRGFTKTFDNAVYPYESYPTSLDVGEMCYKAPHETNEDGGIKTWKGWRVERKSDAPDADDWEQINLCNPCGLWFHKMKVPRPPEKWQKKEPKKEKKRKRPPKPPKSRTQPRRSATGGFDSDMPESDAQEPGSEDSSPADTSAEDGMEDNNDTPGDENQEPELPPIPQSMTARFGRRTVLFADLDTRQVKSSPLARGTSAMPIDIDLTPNKPLRRVLFPSPGSNQDRQSSVPLMDKHNEQLLPSLVRRSPRLNKVRDLFAAGPVAVPMISIDGTAEVIGKENVTPCATRVVHELDDDLFGDFDDAMPPPPTTPTPKRRSERIQSRTPQTARSVSREFGAVISGNARKTPKSPKTPGRKQDQDVLSNLFIDSAARKLDFESMTPFTQQMAIAISVAVTPTSRQSSTRTGVTPGQQTLENPSASTFDFPNLPSLEGSSPSRGGLGDLFSDFPTERLFSEIETMIATDAPMPSSPPVQQVGWDESIDHMVELEHFESQDWSWFGNEQEDTSKLQTPRKQGGHLTVTTPGKSALRRSPRRAGREY